MWMITLKPIGTVDAWQTCLSSGAVRIGWSSRHLDDEPPVRRFREIEIGDWVVAHVPESQGGAAATALGVGRIEGPYEEVPRANPPAGIPAEGAFWRQYRVDWTVGTFDGDEQHRAKRRA